MRRCWMQKDMLILDSEIIIAIYQSGEMRIFYLEKKGVILNNKILKKEIR